MEKSVFIKIIFFNLINNIKSKSSLKYYSSISYTKYIFSLNQLTKLWSFFDFVYCSFFIILSQFEIFNGFYCAYRSRKLNTQLENAIQEAMAELDKVDDSSKTQPRKEARSKSSKSVLATLAAATVTITKNGRSESKRTSKKNTESRWWPAWTDRNLRFSNFTKLHQNDLSKQLFLQWKIIYDQKKEKN